MNIETTIKSAPGLNLDLITVDIIKIGPGGSRKVKEFDYESLTEGEKKIVDDFVQLIVSK